MMKRTIQIDGQEIEITAQVVDGGRCGPLYHCFDTYGEPCISEEFFTTAKAALDNREQTLRLMFA